MSVDGFATISLGVVNSILLTIEYPSELIVEAVDEKLSAQLSTINDLDSKASIFLSVLVAATGGQIKQIFLNSYIDAYQRNVYHDYDNCPQGSRIKPENRRPGENGRSRCDECKQLD